MRHVSQRAERVADRVSDACAAAVDREAGEQRRLLHRLADVEVGRVADGSREVLEHEADGVQSGRGNERVPAPGDCLDGVDERVESVAVVTWFGIVTVAAGSSTTRSGSNSSPHVHTLRPVRSVRMHVRVTSAPVPAVVGIAIIGRRPGIGWAPSA